MHVDAGHQAMWVPEKEQLNSRNMEKSENSALRTCEDVGPLGLAPTRGGKGAGKGKLPTAGGGGGVVIGKDSLSEITVPDTLVSLLGDGGVAGLGARCCCCCALAALEAKASKDIWLICLEGFFKKNGDVLWTS